MIHSWCGRNHKKGSKREEACKVEEKKENLLWKRYLRRKSKF